MAPMAVLSLVAGDGEVNAGLRLNRTAINEIICKRFFKIHEMKNIKYLYKGRLLPEISEVKILNSS